MWLDARGHTLAAMDVESIVQQVEALSDAWAGQRIERQRRRELDARDFDRLAEAGFAIWQLGPGRACPGLSAPAMGPQLRYAGRGPTAKLATLPLAPHSPSTALTEI
jgi:hypothetical protein